MTHVTSPRLGDPIGLNPSLNAGRPSLADLRGVLFDMDGVIYVGQTPLPGAQAVFDHMTTRGIPYCLVTNNSTKTTRQYVEKLAAMGISVPESTILTSAVATAAYLKRLEPVGAPVYVIGEIGLVAALREAGFWLDERSPKYVCVGLDTALTYEKLKRAALAIRAGAQLIATNPDTTLPTEEGLTPGCGSILAALETATDVKPLVVGKPSAAIIDLAIEIIGAERGRTAIIGDRLDTDALAGLRAGIDRILILTGVHQVADIDRFEARPNWVVDSLPEFLRLLAGGEPRPGEYRDEPASARSSQSPR